MANKKVVSGVYGIQCNVTGEWYVGASKNVYERLRQHFSEMKTYGVCAPAARKYGIENMEAHVIELVEDLSKLKETEAFWIEKLDAIKNGYNGQSSRNNIHWISNDV